MSAYVIPALCNGGALHNLQQVQSGAVWNRPALFGVDLCGEQEVRGRIDWVSGESYQESFTITDCRLIFLGHITSSRHSVKLQNKAVLTTELHVCSGDAQTNLDLASKKKTLRSHPPPFLTSVEQDGPIFFLSFHFLCEQEWKTHIN